MNSENENEMSHSCDCSAKDIYSKFLAILVELKARPCCAGSAALSICISAAREEGFDLEFFLRVVEMAWESSAQNDRDIANIAADAFKTRIPN